jgi:hypothetical protein
VLLFVAHASIQRVRVAQFTLPRVSSFSEGLQAYSMEQAALHKQLHTSFKGIWRQPLEDTEDEEGEVVDGEGGRGIDGDDDEDAEDDSEEGDDEEDGDVPNDNDDN